MKVLFRFFVIFLVAAGFLQFVVATDMARAGDWQKLDTAKTTLAQAREQMADVLSPETYDKAKKAYEKAVKMVAEGKSLEKIRELLDESIQESKAAMENTELAKVTFEDAISARQKALEANAAELAPQDWEKAKQKLYDGANALERGKANKAKELGAEARDLFLPAELNAIKQALIGETKKLIAKLEEGQTKKLAPITLEKAKQQINAAEAILDKDRYRKEEAEAVNQVANYEARHARNLAETIANNQGNKTSQETIYLGFEEELMSLGKAAGKDLQFDNGIKAPVNTLRTDLAQLTRERDSLEAEYGKLEDKYVGTKKDRAAIEEELTAIKEIRERVKGAARLFGDQEAQVLLEKKELIIRLTGYAFPYGTATLEPKAYPLLTKVKKAIEEFPGSTIVIEGHTDSTGNLAHNKKLSQERADAIRAYLVSNGIQPSQITAVGYGPEKPIATNDTAANRAKNRRVDVVIGNIL